MERYKAADDRITWMGRTRIGNAGSVCLGYPGITMTIRIRAMRIVAELTASSPDCFFNVIVDGGSPRIARAQTGHSEIVLAEGLSDGLHELHMVRRTESWQGTAEIHALQVDGELLVPPQLPERRLLLIGDSVTCGAGADLMPPDWPEGHLASNAHASFGIELGRRLRSQVHLVSYGGRGLTRDWQGLTNDQINNAPVFFERALPDDAGAPWDHASWLPDAVVIGLGTNDFNQGIPDEKLWVEAYAAFLGRIRHVHPKAMLVLTSSPFFGARLDNGDAAKAAALNHYLDETIAKRLDAGDRNVVKLMLRHQPGTSRDSHPIAPQHLLMADDIEPVLRSRLGW